ncbi:serine protease inhibitor 88Ea-like isoform X2 [Prorops nasuta]|uniref:serine protease inhibitor 88Ea-like isoform X2 n=1 Tax=Prorops nasuta TaxID=863751 RepID=UPI0034CF4251
MISVPMFVFLILFATGISGQCLTENDNPPMMNPEMVKGLTDARFTFAMDSLRKTALIETTDNIFFSPHSLHQALTLAYFGARGTTEASLKSALRIPDNLSKIDVQRLYAFEQSIRQQRDSQENATSDYVYRSANKLWLTDAKKLRECVFDFFDDELEKVDFKKNPADARKRINDWVSNTTKGHIRDLLPEGSIDDQTDCVLSNAVFFKGFWQSRFDPANSKKDLFYISGSQNSVVKFMRQKKAFNHVVSEELGAHVLELPYKGEEVSMYVLLPPFATARALTDQQPSDRDGVRQLIERLSTEKGAQELKELLEVGMPLHEVEVSIPRFGVERELPLGQLLPAMGAGEVLTPSADLRGFLADGEASLHIGDAVHRAKIEVTEEGTTAAAATAIFSFRSSRPSEPAIFNANHPFIYFIYDQPTRTILFSGVYRTPAPITPETS